MRILFKTFPRGHLVSDKEFDRLQKGFTKVGMELVREGDYDILMVKGWSHKWEDLPHDKPIVYYSIGTEWKVGATPELNEPIKDLYFKSDYIVHISKYCQESSYKVFGKTTVPETVIIPACEPNLPLEDPELKEPLKLAITCIPRPVKRADETEALCKKYNIELVPAWGGVQDFSYYHDCHGYIHLSRKEGMPNTVLEALSYGLPCIVTNYGGAKEAMGDAGIVIKNDPEGPWNPDHIEPIDELLFLKAITDFKNNYYELRAKARERVLSELNDYVCANQFKEIYENLLLRK